MNIMIMSDLVPAASGNCAYTEGNLEALIDSEMLDKILHADLNIVNLECPLTVQPRPISKWGSCLKADPECIQLLKRIPNLLVNLANNHINDYGEEGIRDTIELLEKYDIPYVGISEGEKEQVGKIVCIGNQRVGVYSCTEHEFSVAERGKMGAVPFSGGEDIFKLQDLATECDYLIVLYHGGIEFYPYPTPQMQKNLRTYVKAGADLVVCQHSHCIGCLEEYENGTIIYGQGNFLFAPREEVEENIADHEMWKKGVLIEVSLPKKRLDYHFYEKENEVLVLKEHDQEYQNMLARSEVIKDEKAVTELFQQYCRRHASYMSIFKKSYMGQKTPLKTRIKQALKILCGRAEQGDHEYLRIHNYLSCEAHIELLRENSHLKIEEVFKSEGE